MLPAAAVVSRNAMQLPVLARLHLSLQRPPRLLLMRPIAYCVRSARLQLTLPTTQCKRRPLLPPTYSAWILCRPSTTSTPPQPTPPSPPASSSPPPPPPLAPPKHKKEDIYTIPNALTTARLVLSPGIGYLIVSEQFPLALTALIVAGFSDMLDGWIARRYNMKTFLGSALDPAADKMLMTVLTVSLYSADLLPVPLAALILGRDLFLVAGTAWYRYKSLPPPKTFKRYFDLALPSAEVRPPFISKLNTLLQLMLMSASVAAPVFGYVDGVALEALRWIVGGTTIWSGAQYLLDPNVIKILPQKGK
ncbi:hypothetical protein HDU86_007603 [Geranomyces michiganensis]|nr:hypothetical protein HDU86_007603 [Geranomyces michiganensis]